MKNLPDYLIFVKATYIIDAIILTGFTLLSLSKFRKNHIKLINLQKGNKGTCRKAKKINRHIQNGG